MHTLCIRPAYINFSFYRSLPNVIFLFCSWRGRVCYLKVNTNRKVYKELIYLKNMSRVNQNLREAHLVSDGMKFNCLGEFAGSFDENISDLAKLSATGAIEGK